MLNEKVSDEWEEHLKQAGIKYEKITEPKKPKKNDLQDTDG